MAGVGVSQGTPLVTSFPSPGKGDHPIGGGRVVVGGVQRQGGVTPTAGRRPRSCVAGGGGTDRVRRLRADMLSL